MSREIKFRGYDTSDNSGMYDTLSVEQMIEDGNRTVKFELSGRVKELPLTDDMVVVILKEVWAKSRGVKVKSKADMTKEEASELIDISIEWAARFLHCSIPEPSKL